jgi:hypothetical protein
MYTRDYGTYARCTPEMTKISGHDLGYSFKKLGFSGPSNGVNPGSPFSIAF